ncbi:hypothetical protein SAMN05518801_104252 [Novosphingobium sp. CF614]|nr:hypothetical protein [Novosphingobium sp. CF614]SFF97107.1 hypothetical protein SAMN05518801_104252 [Novosphingobium sp. CF614]
MAKEPQKYRPIGTVWEPVPPKKDNSSALWGWIVLMFFGVALLSQCS